jgi:hypothetical protein
MATLITKNSSTASAVPAAGDLVKGELAVNVTDKKLYTKDNSAAIVKVVGSLGNQEANAVAITGGTVSGVAQTGGTINNAVIGGSTPQAVTGTTVTATTGFSGPLTGTVTGNVTGNLTGNVTGNVTGNLTGNVTASTGSSSFNNVTINGSLDMNAGSSATITGLSAPVNGSDAATKTYVDTAISGLIDSAPGTLDTLNELAAALGDDPNFAASVTTSLAGKLATAGGTMSGAIAMGTNKITGLGDPTSAQDAATKTYVDTQRDTRLATAGGTMSGNINMANHYVTNLPSPVNNGDATSKSYVDGILGSATSAATSAAAAATSATNAANSASSAATSEANAASSASSAAASYDSFDDRYLGAKSSAPTLDNDGNALLTGAIYWNSTSNNLWVWTGSAWSQATLTAGSFATLSGTETLTNKTISGASNTLTNVPLSTAVTGTLPVANGGTGSSSLTANNVLLGNGTSAVQTVAPGSSGNVLTSNGTTWQSTAPAGAGFTYGTKVSPTSVATVDFTGIPSSAKYILLIVDRIAASSFYLDIRLGDSSGFKTTGYSEQGGALQSGTPASDIVAFNNSFIIDKNANGGSLSGIFQFALLDSTSNTWICSYTAVAAGINKVLIGGGSVSLSSALTQLRFTTSINGSNNNMTGGSLNIAYM